MNACIKQDTYNIGYSIKLYTCVPLSLIFVRSFLSKQCFFFCQQLFAAICHDVCGKVCLQPLHFGFPSGRCLVFSCHNAGQASVRYPGVQRKLPIKWITKHMPWIIKMKALSLEHSLMNVFIFNYMYLQNGHYFFIFVLFCYSIKYVNWTLFVYVSHQIVYMALSLSHIAPVFQRCPASNLQSAMDIA